jgi:glycerol-3-phosphate dehydrogenase
MLRSSPGRDVDAAVNILVVTNATGGWAGKSFEVLTNDAGLVPGVSLFWREGDMRIMETFTNGYAMKLEFGPLASNKLPGKIYLSLPDEAKSCIAGTFTAEIRNGQPRFLP